MLKRLFDETKRALGLKPPGRNLTVFPDDIFLVSYPKSGNTWSRFLIANLVWPNKGIDFSNVNRIIPVPEVTPQRDMLRAPRPRIIKSHQCFDPRYNRVIYVVRDPRDTALSQYHTKRKSRTIGDNYPMEAFTESFLQGKACDYGSWGEHVASWLSTRYGRPGFLLLRYEDMIQDTPRELSKVAEFLGLGCTEKEIEEAVRRSTADKMRALEKSQAHLFNATKGRRQDILFVRSARAGDWRSDLPESCALQIEQAWGHLIRFLGYELLVERETKLSDSVFPLSPATSA